MMGNRKMTGKLQLWMFGLVLALLAVGCKPSLPSGIISRGQMEDILYDYHISQSMAGRVADQGVSQRVYEDAVLQKYGVSKDEFDRSLAYYMRHTEELEKLYENVENRLKNEAQALGSSAADAGQFGSMGVQGDTANVWNEARSLVLLPQAPFNQYSFVIKTDTAFHAGDALMLSFDSNFIYQDGTRNACVFMAIRLGNDSIVSNFVQLSMPGHQSLCVQDYDRKGIKEIRGYIVLSKSQSELESQTTLQLMFINNIQLIRTHNTDKPATPGATADTMQTAPAPTDTGKTIALPPQGERLRLMKSRGPLKPEPGKIKIN